MREQHIFQIKHTNFFCPLLWFHLWPVGFLSVTSWEIVYEAIARSERYNLHRTWTHWNLRIWEDMAYRPTSGEKDRGAKGHSSNAFTSYMDSLKCMIHEASARVASSLFWLGGKRRGGGGGARDEVFGQRDYHFPSGICQTDALRILVCDRTYEVKWIQCVSYLCPHSHGIICNHFYNSK